MALVTVCGLFGATSPVGDVPATAAIHTDAPAVLAAVAPCASASHWEAAPALNTSRVTAAAVAADGYVFVLGGWQMTPGYWHEIADVESAPIGPDGALGTWVTTTSLTSPNQALGAVAVNGYVYVVGGWDGSHGLARVERATILADGQLGAWEEQEPLPAERINLSAVATSDQIYALGGYNWSATDVSRGVERAVINPDGSLGPWVETSPMLTGRRSFGAVIAGRFIYVVGGSEMNNPGSGSSVERAEINPDGSLEAWQAMPPILRPRLGAIALVSGGYLYAIGGAVSDYEATTDTVERAAILPDGSLGPWHYVDQLITRRVGHTGASFNEHFYIMSGHHDTDEGYVPVDTVEQVLASDLAPLSDYRITINNDALFTNQAAVSLTVSAPLGTVEMQVSNQPDFAGAAWQACVASISWTIIQNGSSTLPRVVYARFRDAEGVVSGPSSDDILLDVTAPTGTVQVAPLGQAALAGGAPADQLANVMLALAATDDLSGVGSMEIGNDPAFTDGLWEPYATSKAWHLPVDLKTVYVRFRDNAGNVSSVFSDDLPANIYLPLIRRNS